MGEARDNSSISASFWNPDSSNWSHSPGGGTEVTQAEMQTQRLYEDNKWCFASNCDKPIWEMGSDEYPYPVLINAPSTDD